MHFDILGTGLALPATTTPSTWWDAHLGWPLGTLEARTGMQSRRTVADGQTARSLALDAARAALEVSGEGTQGLDLVIGACGVPFRPLPSSAALIAHDLGIKDGQVEALDVNATCLSFLSALSLACLRIAAGRNRRVLIVSADTPSRALPWASAPETAALFGDGAAAMVVGAGTGWKVVRERFETHPRAALACTLPSGGSEVAFHGNEEAFAASAWFAMNGPALFKATHRALPGFLDRLTEDGHGVETWSAAAIHQGSPGALDHIGKQIGLGAERMPRFGHLEGNQMAASLPNAMHKIVSTRSFQPGDRVALMGAGAGLNMGGMLLERV